MASEKSDYGHSQEALKIWEKIFTLEKFIPPIKKGKLNLGIGNIHFELGTHLTAIGFYRKALREYLHLDEHNNIATVYYNIASSYNQAGQFDSSLFYMEKSIDHCLSHGLDSLAWDYKKDIGIQLVENGFIDSGRVYLENLIRESNSPKDRARALLNLGYLEEKIGNLDTAYKNYVKSGKLASEINLFSTHEQALNNQAYSSYFMGEYQRAFELMDSLIWMRNERNEVELAERISALEKKYQNLQREKEVQELRFENERATLITTTAFIILGLVLLISGLTVYTILQRLRQTRHRALNRLNELQRQGELDAMRSVIMAQESERSRIAMDLHDDIGAMLSAARMRVSNLASDLQSSTNNRVIHETESIIRDASTAVRRVSHEMMPGVLTKLGLLEGIEELLAPLHEHHGIETEFSSPGKHVDLPDNVEVMMYRIVQELINNSLKHSEAKKITLKISVLDTHMRLFYADNGLGFNPEDAHIQRSLGMQSIATRVQLLNGLHEISSRPGHGMEVTIDFEIPTAHEDSVS